MSTTKNIIESIIFPILKEDSLFRDKQISKELWDKLIEGFIHYENNPAQLINTITEIKLSSTEKLITKLPRVYHSFINQLAENYVLGIKNEITDELLNNGNKTLVNEISFLSTLSNVIKKVERKDLKNSFSNSTNKITISDETIALAAKKKGREDLKAQFKKWDNEINNEKEVAAFQIAAKSLEDKTNTKVISISFIKYSVAAILVMSIGWFLVDNNMNKSYNTTDIAEVKETTITVPILKNEGLGYTVSTQQNIEVKIVNIQQRIKSLESLIKKDDSYLNEYKKLKKQELNYRFKNDLITIFYNEEIAKPYIIQTNSKKLYIKIEEAFYEIKIKENLQPLIKEDNNKIINDLEKIIFENE